MKTFFTNWWKRRQCRNEPSRILPAFLMIIVSILAALLGAKVNQKVNTKLFQILLAIIIGGTVIKIWLDILS